MAGAFSNHLNRLTQLFDSEPNLSLIRLRRQVRREPQDPGALTALCRALHAHGQHAEALQRLRDFLAQSGEAHLETLGQLALDLGADTVAEECFQRLAEKHPRTAAPIGWLGIVYAQRGDTQAAERELVRATEIEPEQAEPWYRLGSFLLRKRELALAERHLRHALEIDPMLARAHTNLGYLLDLRGERAAALREFQKAVQLAPHDPEGHFNLGALHAEARRYDLAIEQFADGVALAPDRVEGHYNLGAAYFELRRYEEAIRAFRRALRLQPGHEEARYYLGLCYVRKGAYDRALVHFESAHGESPTVSVRLLFAMAQCYNGLEMPRQAVRFLQQVVDLVPDHAKAYHLLGVCFDKLGERDRAGDAYRRSDLHLTLARGRRAAGRIERRP